MQNLCVGLCQEVARIELVCGIRPGQFCACYMRLGGRRCTLGRAPVICRSIWFDLLYFPNHTVGHVCITELLCLYLFGEAVSARVWAELSFYLSHVMVGQSHYALVVLAPAPRHRIEVAICTSGNFWLGVRVHIPELPGPQSIYQ